MKTAKELTTKNEQIVCIECGGKDIRSRGFSWLCADCGRWFLKNYRRPDLRDRGKKDYPKCKYCGGNLVSTGLNRLKCKECGANFQKKYRNRYSSLEKGRKCRWCGSEWVYSKGMYYRCCSCGKNWKKELEEVWKAENEVTLI